MKDVIIKAFPEVLGVLLNNVLYRYSKAGVKYVEFSVSSKDLRNIDYRKIITDQVFSSDYPRLFKSKNKSVPTSARNSTNASSSSTSRRTSHADTLLTNDINDTHFQQDGNSSSSAAKLHAEGNVSSRTFKLPTPKSSDLKPAWRKYLNDYYEKNGQIWNFLGAFNRTEPNYSAIISDYNIESGIENNNAGGLLKLLTNCNTAEESIYDLAKHIINNKVSVMYEESIIKIEGFLDEYIEEVKGKLEEIKDGEKGNQKDQCILADCVAGIDWVGDEFGFPFCAFTEESILKRIQKCREINPNFGIRIHAGEGLIRYSSIAQDKDTAVGKLFRFHLFVIMESIRKIYNFLMEDSATTTSSSSSAKADVPKKCNIRIGHGVAFLYKDETDLESLLNTKLEEFREFLRKADIPCELNPTSNHMLIPTTFGGSTLTNDRSLTLFLKEKLPVVLCTDDDGIWSIHKCSSHYHHISVAHEYCEAIKRDEISSEAELEKLIAAGRNYAFAD